RIGTTKKGIGPAYTDKISRVGIRVADLIDPEVFGKLLKEYLPFKNAQLTKLYGEEALDYDDIYQTYVEYGRQLASYVTDTSYLLGQLMKAGKRVVFEGAQGVMLDVDHGTYPYVTSSNPTAGGVMNGAGVGPKQIQDVVGVIKAYTSRVGEGPFPTELFNDIADHIREVGHEYGVITKRPRRIGWLDAVALRHAVQVSGLTKLAINSLDVLSGLKEIKIATSYTYKGEEIHHFPASDTWFNGLDVNCETLPGWDEDITGVTTFEELPVNAQHYLQRISELLEVDLLSFAVGPTPEQTHLLEPVWHE
ncbi:adenylosuccinate synthase, partial [Leuconostoc falkenbergense]